MEDGAGVAELVRPPVDPSLEAAIDQERFTAVAEHEGDFHKLVERYGENPGSCPYIASMGEVGIRLVQELAESQQSPDRGPTIREMRDARRQQALAAKPTIEKIESAPVAPAKRLGEIEPPLVESVVAAKSEVLQYENHALREQLARIVAEETMQPLHDVKAATEPAKIVLAKPVVVTRRAEKTTVDPSLATTPAPVAPKAKQVQATAHKTPAKPLPFVSLARRAAPASVHIKKATPSERPTQSFEPVKAAVAATEQEITVAVPLQPEVIVEAALDEAMPSSTPDQLSAFDSLNDETLRVPSEQKSNGPLQTHPAELTNFIQALEPAKAEVVETVLATVTEILQQLQERVEYTAEDTVAEIKEIEKLVIERLESLGIDHSDTAIKRVIDSLLQPLRRAVLATNTKLTIDQLNRLGTREYRSLLDGLGQLIQQKFGAHLHVGKYAIWHTKLS